LRVELARLNEIESAEDCLDGAEVEERIAVLNAANGRLREAAHLLEAGVEDQVPHLAERLLGSS
jgi:hypothetical protein